MSAKTKIKGGCTLWARKTFESEIFHSKPAEWFKVWFYLIGKVNHRDNDKFKRGEGYFKYEWIMRDCNATKAQVDHFFRWAKRATMIATRKATRGFYVTISKYYLYQDIGVYRSDTESDSKSDIKATGINKNDKNGIKNVKKEEEKELTTEIVTQKGNVDEIDLQLTQLLITLMQENDPKSSIIRDLTEKRQLAWINSCRLLRERDERTPEQIKQVIEFSQGDDFWKGNILSMPTLRRQFNQLWMKAKPKKSESEKTDEDRDDWIKETQEKLDNEQNKTERK